MTSDLTNTGVSATNNTSACSDNISTNDPQSKSNGNDAPNNIATVASQSNSDCPPHLDHSPNDDLECDRHGGDIVEAPAIEGNGTPLPDNTPNQLEATPWGSNEVVVSNTEPPTKYHPRLMQFKRVYADCAYWLTNGQGEGCAKYRWNAGTVSDKKEIFWDKDRKAQLGSKGNDYLYEPSRHQLRKTANGQGVTLDEYPDWATATTFVFVEGEATGERVAEWADPSMAVISICGVGNNPTPARIDRLLTDYPNATTLVFLADNDDAGKALMSNLESDIARQAEGLERDFVRAEGRQLRPDRPKSDYGDDDITADEIKEALDEAIDAATSLSKAAPSLLTPNNANAGQSLMGISPEAGAVDLHRALGGNGDLKKQVRCPAHSDAKPSLDIDCKGGKVVWICRAGCSQQSVLASLKDREPALIEAILGSKRQERNISPSYDEPRQRSESSWQLEQRRQIASNENTPLADIDPRLKDKELAKGFDLVSAAHATPDFYKKLYGRVWYQAQLSKHGKPWFSVAELRDNYSAFWLNPDEPDDSKAKEQIERGIAQGRRDIDVDKAFDWVSNYPSHSKHYIGNQLIKILGSREEVYRTRDNTLLRVFKTIVPPLPDDPIKVPLGTVTLAPANELLLHHLAGKVIDYYSLNKAEEPTLKAEPPRQLAKDLVNPKGEWDVSEVKVVEVMVQHPIVNKHGVLLNDGYQPSLRAIIRSNLRTPLTIPEKPSFKEAEDALNWLRNEIYGEFAFETPVDEAVALMHLISTISRPFFRDAPITVFDSATPGSGKTLLSSIGARISAGVAPIYVTYTKDEHEFRKRLDTAMLEGYLNITIDDVDGGFDSPSLRSFVTMPEGVVKLRVLGESRSASCSTMRNWGVTGCNVETYGQMNRRVVYCRLAPEMDRSEIEQREFNRPDLEGYLKTARPLVLEKVLTIQRAFFLAGGADAIKDRNLDPPIMSTQFRDCLYLCRSPIYWLTGIDAWGNHIAKAGEDVEGSNKKQLCIAWKEVFADDGSGIRRSAKEFLKGLESAPDSEYDDIIPKNKQGGSSVKALGHRLKGMKGENFRIDGALYQIRGEADGHTNVMVYHLHRVKPKGKKC